MTDKNIHKLPETYTVSYFNESEWNKDLTPVEIEQQQEITDLQNQLEENEKGYGPCHSCGDTNLGFRRVIVLKNFSGSEFGGTVLSTEDAEIKAWEIRNGTGYWEGGFRSGPFSQSSRETLANKIMMQVDNHKNGQSVNETVTSDSDRDDGPCSVM